MPSQVDIVVNNGATTPVSKTFLALTPAAGYGGVAEWALKEGPIAGTFPRLTVSARKTATGSQKATIKLKIPSSFTDTVTGLTKVASSFEVNVEVSVPDTFPESLKNDAVAYTTNILNTALLKSVIRDAFPVT